MESKAEILVGLEKARKEYEVLTQGKRFLTVRDAHEIRRYAKSRTQLDADWEQLTGEERGWRLFYYKMDESLADLLGPEKKREMDLLEGQIEAGEAVAAALERLQTEPWWKRTMIVARLTYHRILYKFWKFVAGRAPQECMDCNGSGRCNGCKGSGKAKYSGYGEASTQSCSRCQGTGVCVCELPRNGCPLTFSITLNECGGHERITSVSTTLHHLIKDYRCRSICFCRERIGRS